MSSGVYHETGGPQEICVWDIGTPSPPEYNSSLELVQTLTLDSPGIAMTFSIHCNMLLSGTETGAVGWSLPDTALKKTDK